MTEELRLLAERVETAGGPDRELDCDIALAMGELTLADGYEPKAVFGRTFSTFTGPRYTASLDAAMSLAEGFGGEVTFFKDGAAKAFLWQPYPMAIEAKAATPALAICAAALRARAAQEQRNEP